MKKQNKLSPLTGSLNILLMYKLNELLKILANKINTLTLHSVNKNVSNFIYRNEMHYNYKLYENILETLIQRNIFPTDPKKNKTYHIL